MGKINWKPDDRGNPNRRLPASYIMHHDPRARAAYTAMRHRGLSAQDAEHEVETVGEKGFYETLVFGIDRRLELWISLEEGLRAADLFADIDVAMNQKLGEGADLIERVRREKSEFICMEAIDSRTKHKQQVYVAMKPHPRYAIPGGVITLEAAKKYDGRKVDDAFWDELLAEDWLEIIDDQPTLAANGRLRFLYIEGDTIKLGPLHSEAIERSDHQAQPR
jgi:hypothetical protein